MDVPDRIEKRIVLRAPLARVWRAISDSREFGAWFGARFEGPFVTGERLNARIHPTEVDPEVAKLQEPHAGAPFEITVERVEPERALAFRWKPFGASETTLVELTLSAVADGTQLTIVESGFSRLPIEQRAKAFTSNEGGWEHQTRLLERYLAAR